MGDEPVAQGGKARGEPPVERHIGEHARTIKEARLGGDEEQGRLGRQRNQDERESRSMRPGGGQLLEEHRVEGLADLGLHAKDQVADHQAGHGHREGNGHVAHGPLPGLNPWFPQDRQAVADGFNPSVRACPHAIGPQHQQGHTEPAELLMRRADIGGCALPDLGHIAQVRADHVKDDEGMGQHKHYKNRHPRQYRLFCPAQVEQCQ